MSLLNFVASPTYPEEVSAPDRSKVTLHFGAESAFINALETRGITSMKNLEGHKAPVFSLPGNDGKQHSLDEFRGRTVVLFFYPKDSTPG